MNDEIMNEGPVRARWLSAADAETELERFQENFGPKALYLAAHAAIPLILSPELLHLIRINFLEGLQIPLVAETDLLLSPLCRSLDPPLYEMEPRIREILIEHLEADFGPSRAYGVAKFLLYRLSRQSADAVISEEAEQNHWAHQAWLRPVETVAELKRAFHHEAAEGYRADRMHLARLAEQLAVPILMDSAAKVAYRNFLPEIWLEWDKGNGDGSNGTGTTEGLAAGAVATVPLPEIDLEISLAWIPPGEFIMGSPEDEPGRNNNEKQHRVRLTKGFWMQTTPVTVGQWRRFIKEYGYAGEGDNIWGCNGLGDPKDLKQEEDHPVTCVSWHEARAFINWLNGTNADWQFRLPTEAEWEHACRAGTDSALYTGPIEILGDNNAPALDEIAWYGGNSGVEHGGADSSGWSEKQYDHKRAGTHPVGLKKPNGWGLYDMLGNVYEWCFDWHDSNFYSKSPIEDPTGPTDGEDRVIRGGSWSANAWDCRAASGAGTTRPTAATTGAFAWSPPRSGELSAGNKCSGMPPQGQLFSQGAGSGCGPPPD